MANKAKEATSNRTQRIGEGWIEVSSPGGKTNREGQKRSERNRGGKEKRT